MNPSSQDEARVTLSDRIGGRWVISWQVYLVLLVSFGFLLLSLLAQSDGADGPTLVAYWLAACSVGALVAVVAHRTVFAHRATTPVRPWVVGVYQLLAGVPSSFLFEFGRERAGFPILVPMPTRVVSLAATQTLVGLTVTLLFDYWARWQAEREKLIEARVRTALLDRSLTDLYREMESQVTEDIRSAIATDNPSLLVAVRLGAGSSLVRHAPEITGAMSDLVGRVVQPLSQSLWETTAQTYPRVTLKQMIVAVFSTQPINTLGIVVFYLLTNVAGVLADAGPWRGAVWITLTVALITIVSRAANSLMRTFPRFHLTILLGTFVLFQVLTYATTLLHNWFGLPALGPGLFVVTAMSSAMLITITSLLGAWFGANREATGHLAAEIDEERIRVVALSRQTAEYAQELARRLHGSLQTRLTTCGLTIERALRDGDEAALNVALLEALSVLRSPLTGVAVGESLGDEVDRKVSLWRELCAIQVNIDPRIRHEPHSRTREVGRVVEEAISNAVRHGGASELRLSVTGEPGGAVVVALDDNGTLKQNPRPGIGSALFAQATGGNWSLSGTPTGSRLLATIPVLPTNV